MDRRSFVRLSAYTAAILSLPVDLSCTRKYANTWAQPLFISHLVDLKTIIAIGQSYRKMVPDEDSRLVLYIRLKGHNEWEDEEGLRAALDSVVVTDFLSERTVTVNGWILSVTEARQCALFSILNA